MISQNWTRRLLSESTRLTGDERGSFFVMERKKKKVKRWAGRRGRGGGVWAGKQPLVKRATVAPNVKAEVGRKEEGEGGKISCNWRVRRLSIAGIGWKV